MTAGKPIPSRATLNALRGLVFTTTCSVALLAEERRRRLILARKAVENARKLRNVKAQMRLSDLEVPILDSATDSRPIRQRKRNRKPTVLSSRTPSSRVRETPLPEPTQSTPRPSQPEAWVQPDTFKNPFRQSIRSTASKRCSHSHSTRFEHAYVGTRMMQVTSQILHQRHYSSTKSRKVPSLPRSQSSPNDAPPMTDNGKSLDFDYKLHLSKSDLRQYIDEEVAKIKEQTPHWLRKKEMDKLAETIRVACPVIDFDASIRYLANTYKLGPRSQWGYYVFRFYAQCLTEGPILSWLRFLFSQQIYLDPSAFDLLYRKCESRWGFTQADVLNLYKTLAAEWNGVPSPSSASTHYKSTHLQRLKSATPGLNRADWKETWKDVYIRRTRQECTGLSKDNAGTADTFKKMEDAARTHDWELVWDVARANLADLSSPCFRLAVLALIELEGGRTARAKAVVWERAKQHDVSTAITPLLMAQLDEGRNPLGLIVHTLSKDVTIRDEVYNKASRLALKSGKAQDALEIGHLAVQNNGGNDMFYNQRIMLTICSSQLVLQEYECLTDLLDTFMEHPRPYAATQMFSTGIKFMIRQLAHRVRNPSLTVQERTHHLQMLEKVAEVLIKTKPSHAAQSIPQTLFPHVAQSVSQTVFPLDSSINVDEVEVETFLLNVDEIERRAESSFWEQALEITLLGKAELNEFDSPGRKDVKEASRQRESPDPVASSAQSRSWQSEVRNSIAECVDIHKSSRRPETSPLRQPNEEFLSNIRESLVPFLEKKTVDWIMPSMKAQPQELSIENEDVIVAKSEPEPVEKPRDKLPVRDETVTKIVQEITDQVAPTVEYAAVGSSRTMSTKDMRGKGSRSHHARVPSRITRPRPDTSSWRSWDYAMSKEPVGVYAAAA